jgi:hypothetical protein
MLVVEEVEPLVRDCKVQVVPVDLEFQFYGEFHLLMELLTLDWTHWEGLLVVVVVDGPLDLEVLVVEEEQLMRLHHPDLLTEQLHLEEVVEQEVLIRALQVVQDL